MHRSMLDSEKLSRRVVEAEGVGDEEWLNIDDDGVLEWKQWLFILLVGNEYQGFTIVKLVGVRVLLCLFVSGEKCNPDE